MTKILFICLGNICRSPMAKFVMKDLVEKAGLADEFQIDSAATCRDEIGNPVYPPARRKLAEHGISCEGHAARQLTAQDYEEYDLLIGMEGANLKNMQRICGGDPAGKSTGCSTTPIARATSPTRGIQAILKRRGGMSRRAVRAFWRQFKIKTCKVRKAGLWSAFLHLFGVLNNFYRGCSEFVKNFHSGITRFA